MRCTALELADGPVIKGLEAFEIVYAKDQPEYRPLRALQSMKSSGGVLSRWTLTEEQREAIANGEDIYLEILTFQGPLQPVLLFVGAPTAEEFAERYGLAE